MLFFTCTQHLCVYCNPVHTVKQCNKTCMLAPVAEACNPQYVFSTFFFAGLTNVPKANVAKVASYNISVMFYDWNVVFEVHVIEHEYDNNHIMSLCGSSGGQIMPALSKLKTKATISPHIHQQPAGM